MVRSFLAPYLSVISSVSCGSPSVDDVLGDVAFLLQDARDLDKLLRATASWCVALYAEFALRMRVSISAMGSVMLMWFLLWSGMIRSAVRVRPWRTRLSERVSPYVRSAYQLALRTPGSSPRLASSRTQIRHMPNWR